jgi:hypothetical protein
MPERSAPIHAREPAETGNIARAQEVEHRPAIDGQVSFVQEVWQQIVEVLNIVGLTGISLLLK